MRRAVLCSIACGLLAAGSDRPAAAQNLTVQQPAFGVNSVGTTVVVPDRGSALLGGVGSAGASRKQFGFGPFRPGSSIGQFHSASSTSVSVYIHDFEAMDRYLLGQGGGAASDSLHLSGNAAHAWQRLAGRSVPGIGSSRRISAGGRFEAARSAPFTQAAPSTTPSAGSPSAGSAAAGVHSPAQGVSTADRSLQLGRAALERGSGNVARMHFRMAVRHGSQAARRELAQLDGDGEASAPLARAER